MVDEAIKNYGKFDVGIDFSVNGVRRSVNDAYVVVDTITAPDGRECRIWVNPQTYIRERLSGNFNDSIDVFYNLSGFLYQDPWVDDNQYYRSIYKAAVFVEIFPNMVNFSAGREEITKDDVSMHLRNQVNDKIYTCLEEEFNKTVSVMKKSGYPVKYWLNTPVFLSVNSPFYDEESDTIRFSKSRPMGYRFPDPIFPKDAVELLSGYNVFSALFSEKNSVIGALYSSNFKENNRLVSVMPKIKKNDLFSPVYIDSVATSTYSNFFGKISKLYCGLKCSVAQFFLNDAVRNFIDNAKKNDNTTIRVVSNVVVDEANNVDNVKNFKYLRRFINDSGQREFTILVKGDVDVVELHLLSYILDVTIEHEKFDDFSKRLRDKAKVNKKKVKKVESDKTVKGFVLPYDKNFYDNIMSGKGDDFFSKNPPTLQEARDFSVDDLKNFDGVIIVLQVRRYVHYSYRCVLNGILNEDTQALDGKNVLILSKGGGAKDVIVLNALADRVDSVFLDNSFSHRCNSMKKLESRRRWSNNFFVGSEKISDEKLLYSYVYSLSVNKGKFLEYSSTMKIINTMENYNTKHFSSKLLKQALEIRGDNLDPYSCVVVQRPNLRNEVVERFSEDFVKDLENILKLFYIIRFWNSVDHVTREKCPLSSYDRGLFSEALLFGITSKDGEPKSMLAEMVLDSLFGWVDENISKI